MAIKNLVRVLWRVLSITKERSHMSADNDVEESNPSRPESWQLHQQQLRRQQIEERLQRARVKRQQLQRRSVQRRTLHNLKHTKTVTAVRAVALSSHWPPESKKLLLLLLFGWWI